MWWRLVITHVGLMMERDDVPVCMCMQMIECRSDIANTEVINYAHTRTGQMFHRHRSSTGVTLSRQFLPLSLTLQ